MNTLHRYLIYYLLVINAATFIIYGIDTVSYTHLTLPTKLEV